jgi:hypothetical protein
LFGAAVREPSLDDRGEPRFKRRIRRHGKPRLVPRQNVSVHGAQKLSSTWPICLPIRTSTQENCARQIWLDGFVVEISNPMDMSPRPPALWGAKAVKSGVGASGSRDLDQKTSGEQFGAGLAITVDRPARNGLVACHRPITDSEAPTIAARLWRVGTVQHLAQNFGVA